MKWKYFYSSVKGTSHIALDTPKQDNCKICSIEANENSYLVAAVADGAGSAKYSDSSSKFICKLFLDRTRKWLLNDNKLQDLTKDVIKEWFVYFQKVISRAVKIYKLETSRDFATTLLFSILSNDYNIFVQIGDGIIAIGDENDMNCVFLPQNGEFINTTHFATESQAQNIFMFNTSIDPVKRIAMHTDGLEQIALDTKAAKPFLPFFNSFFSALNKTEDYGYSDKLSQKLEEFLASDRVNKKTDDDKTLFLAAAFELSENKEAEPING